MAQWDNYSQKSTPADTDTLMLKDNAATGKPNKRLLFSGLWTWIVDKLTNASINALQTTTKTVVGGMNNLQQAVTTLNSNSVAKRGVLNSTSIDLDDYTSPGIWLCTNIVTNIPITAYGELIVTASGPASQEVFQRFYTLEASPVCYIRQRNSNAWNPWVKLPTRAEMDAMNSKTGGLTTSFGVDMNQNKTYEITTSQGYPIYFMFGQATGGSPFAVIIGGGGLTTANPTVYYQTVGSQTIIESVTAETNKIIIKFSNNYAQFTIMSRQAFTGQIKP